jgi:hypothetical protein
MTNAAPDDPHHGSEEFITDPTGHTPALLDRFGARTVNAFGSAVVRTLKA